MLSSSSREFDYRRFPRTKIFSAPGSARLTREECDPNIARHSGRKVFTRFQHYATEDVTGLSRSHQAPMLKSLTDEQSRQAECKIHLDADGEERLYNSLNEPLNCKNFIFIIDHNDKILSAPKFPDHDEVETSPITGRDGYIIQHSTLAPNVKGRPVKYAGEFDVTDGKITFLSRHSGHYLLGMPMLELMSQKFSSLLTEDAEFHIASRDGQAITAGRQLVKDGMGYTLSSLRERYQERLERRSRDSQPQREEISDITGTDDVSPPPFPTTPKITPHESFFS